MMARRGSTVGPGYGRGADELPVSGPAAPRNVPTYQEAVTALCGGREGPGYVLGIDQATSSGFALVNLRHKRCVFSGTAVGADQQEAVIAALALVPGVDWRSCLVVFEDHSHIPATKGIPTASLLKLGEARGRWMALLSHAGQPEEARILAAPDAWRKMLGTRVHLPRDAWKAQAKLWASALTGHRITNEDEAEAVVIAMWGAHEGLLRWASHRAEQVGARTRRRPRKDTAHE